MRIETLDLEFGSIPQTIASFLVFGPEGPVLIETGPGSTLPALLSRLDEHGVRSQDVRNVLVTHIHLDHSGAAGWWAQQGATVYVHPRGARHLIDPSRLMASAARIYGDRMDELWGESLPAPADKIVAVEDGEEISAGGLRFIAIETSGHARHHHAYRLGDIGFTGDSTGILLPGKSWIDLPAPPPEFDLAVWKQTLERLRGERFATIYRTHFGPATEVEEQLSVFEDVLEEGAGVVRKMMRQGLDRDAMVEGYCTTMRERAASAGIDDDTAQAYELANPRYMSVDGIIRYWSKLGQ